MPHSADDPAIRRLRRQASTLRSDGRLREAASVYDHILRVHEATPAVLNEFADLALALKDHATAHRLAEQSLQLQPGQAVAWLIKGMAARHLAGMAEALRCIDRAIEADPAYAAAHFQKARKLLAIGRIEPALHALDLALEADPRHVPARLARATLRADLRCVPEAMADVEDVLRHRPGHAGALHLQAELLLLEGDYEKGWRLYEARRRLDGGAPIDGPTSAQPWRGEPLSGRRLLVVPEIGFGDTVMFARFIPELLRADVKVTLQTQQPLASLMAASLPQVQVIARGDALPAVDMWCPIMSLPLASGCVTSEVPAAVPYLKVPDEALARWRQALGPRHRPRVGIVWSGRANRDIDRNPAKRRSMPLEALASLLALPFEWHSLQKELLDGDAQAAAALPHLHQHGPALADFADTAALTSCMDWVISTDTAVAHVAGALGKPLWMMLPYASDYRWPRTSGRSPWYPTARLFRQPSPADWESVLQAVAAHAACQPGAS